MLTLRARSSFPRTGTSCETGNPPIRLRLILLTVLQPEEFCHPAGLGAALHFSLVSELRLSISSHCCDTIVSKGKPVRELQRVSLNLEYLEEITNTSVLGLLPRNC